MMTEEERKKAIEEQQLADLMHYRRLRIGGPIYGSLDRYLKLKKAQLVAQAAPLTTARYTCGYWDASRGCFSPYPS